MVHALRKLYLKTEISCLTWSVFNGLGEENDINMRHSYHLIKLPQNFTQNSSR